LGDRRARWMEACYGGTDVIVMERPFAMAWEKDINRGYLFPALRIRSPKKNFKLAST
jgi:hypothetical protein